MKKKYSDNFERDNKFYFENIKHFNFCGTLTPKFEAIEDINGKTAKEVFYLIDSTGKNHPTCEPKLLNDLLMCKASVNFHIKQWAEGRADGSLPFCEFAGWTENQWWWKQFYGRVEYMVTRHAHNVKQRIQTPSLLPEFSLE